MGSAIGDAKATLFDCSKVSSVDGILNRCNKKQLEALLTMKLTREMKRKAERRLRRMK